MLLSYELIVFFIRFIIIIDNYYFKMIIWNLKKNTHTPHHHITILPQYGWYSLLLPIHTDLCSVIITPIIITFYHHHPPFNIIKLILFRKLLWYIHIIILLVMYLYDVYLWYILILYIKYSILNYILICIYIHLYKN